jgi:hypothetical protein
VAQYFNRWHPVPTMARTGTEEDSHYGCFGIKNGRFSDCSS